MRLPRRTLLGTAAAASLLHRPARAENPTIRIGVLNDQSGPYRDDGGPTSVICAQQAVQEFTAAKPGLNIDVISRTTRTSPTWAGIARQWFDQGDVDAIVDVPTSSVALAVNTVCREKNKVMLNSGAATTDLTGAQCSPNTIHWTYDTYMLAKSTGGAMVKAGGDSWYFITANYVFGHQLQRDTDAVREGGRWQGAGQQHLSVPGDHGFLLSAASGAGIRGEGARLVQLGHRHDQLHQAGARVRLEGERCKIAAMLTVQQQRARPRA